MRIFFFVRAVWEIIYSGFKINNPHARVAERIFMGGGCKEKKGHCNVQKGTNGIHTDNNQCVNEESL